VRAVHASARVARHTVTSVVQAVLIVAIIASLVMAYAVVTHHGPVGAGQVLAGGKTGGGSTTGGKGGGKVTSGGTLGLVMVSDNDHNGAVTVGDEITYDVSRTTVTNPYVTTRCYVNGTLVLSQWAGFYAGYTWPAARVVTLTNENWTSGAGNCRAELYATSTVLTFDVGA
jgi:hypothetical protein